MLWVRCMDINRWVGYESMGQERVVVVIVVVIRRLCQIGVL